jgi:hypothetical protein
MKNSYYFPHDYHARHDPKLEKLRICIGLEGVGLYWCLIEMLYENGGYLLIKDQPFIAKALDTTEELLEEVINQYNLFEKHQDTFCSQSQLVRLKHINGKRWKAKVSANKRWNANAMPTHSEGNAIKYSKVKESKVNKYRDIPPLLQDVINYCKERGKGVDPNKWFDFYASKGWLIGKNKMKDWSAAVRTWEKEDMCNNITPRRVL